MYHTIQMLIKFDLENKKVNLVNEKEKETLQIIQVLEIYSNDKILQALKRNWPREIPP